MKKSDREIMEILEAFDTTGCANSAARLAGVDPKTVRSYVAARDTGKTVTGPSVRPKIIDPFMEKIEELVDKAQGLVRADRVHERIVAMGFGGDERTTRRAVRAAKARWRAGHRRSYRPWITEPGLWLQFDWGEGAKVPGPDGVLRRTWLFCAWLAWSRFRVVIPVWDQTMATLVACLDATLRTIGAVPAFILTDNAKTVTVDHVAGVAIRHPLIVEAGRHYGCTVHTCVPYDPQSKGGVEATVRIAKADLVPTSVNLAEEYESFAQLEHACQEFMGKVNGRIHRETGKVPKDMLALEVARMHLLPARPHTVGLGETRRVGPDQTVRYGSVRYSVPPGLIGAEVWVRVHGDDFVIIADLADSITPGLSWVDGRTGLVEVARHKTSTPGNPRINADHYPGHPQTGDGLPRAPRVKARSAGEEQFLAIGDGATAWLIEAGAVGASRVRAKMARAVEVAALFGPQSVDMALGIAATAGRFGDDDLESIIEHMMRDGSGQLVAADEMFSAQPGTNTWAGFTTQAAA
jgi:transposase